MCKKLFLALPVPPSVGVLLRGAGAGAGRCGTYCCGPEPDGVAVTVAVESVDSVDSSRPENDMDESNDGAAGALIDSPMPASEFERVSPTGDGTGRDLPSFALRPAANPGLFGEPFGLIVIAGGSRDGVLANCAKSTDADLPCPGGVMNVTLSCDGVGAR